ncbi:hypothetical protein DSECCO2_520300 [anaerobic digester metagenome]
MDGVIIKEGAVPPDGVKRLARGKVFDVSGLDDAAFRVGYGEGVEGDAGDGVVGAVDRVEEDGARISAHIGAPELLADQAAAERVLREVVDDDILGYLVDQFRGRSIRAHPHAPPCFGRSDQSGYGVGDSPGQIVACPDELHHRTFAPPLYSTVYLCTAI